MYRKLLLFVIVTCLLFVTLGAVALHADTFIFNGTGPGVVDFSGTLTAMPTADPSQFLVTSLTGDFNGMSLTLIPGGPGTTLSPHGTWLFNNILSLSSPHLDNLGLGVFVNGVDGNIFYLANNGSDTGYFIAWGNTPPDSIDMGPLDLSVTRVTPEPGSLLLLGTGMLGLLGLVRRKLRA